MRGEERGVGGECRWIEKNVNKREFEGKVWNMMETEGSRVWIKRKG